VVEAIRERIGDLVYGEGDETLEAVVGRLLAEKAKTIAVAESCTGGLIAEKLTDIPGSSEYFLGGVVAYANSAKQDLLGVPESFLADHGAVSEPVARAMAYGVRERFGADIGVATTGISGPGGGSEGKPVGLVYLAIAWGAPPGESAAGKDRGLSDDTGAENAVVESFVFPVDRSRHRALTAQVALDWVRRMMLGLEWAAPSLMRQAGDSIPGSQAGKETKRNFTPRTGSVDSGRTQESSGGN
jgi:nicotinamide-nucleotide amidase